MINVQHYSKLHKTLPERQLKKLIFAVLNDYLKYSKLDDMPPLTFLEYLELMSDIDINDVFPKTEANKRFFQMATSVNSEHEFVK